MPDAAPSPELLIEHADFVRALARRLLADADAAEDVAQESLLAALVRPPRSAGRLRAWLASVARRQATQRLRADGRRRAREDAVAAAAAAPTSPAEVVEREAARAAVVRALLAVPEPSRAVLLATYYEGLPPRRIAARLGVPVETVRTRHRRGIAALRRRLEEDEGLAGSTFALALAPLARGPRAAAPLAASGTGLGVAAVAAAAVVAVALAVRARPDVGAGASAVDLADAAAARGPEELELRAEPSARELAVRGIADGPAATSSTDVRTLAGPAAPAATRTTGLALRFTGPDRRRLAPERVEVELRPESGGGSPRTVEVLGADGASFSDLPAGVWLARARGPGFAHREQRFDLTTGDANEVDELGRPRFVERLFLWPDGWAAIAVRTADGGAFRGAADSLGIAPDELFVAAFAARVRLDPPRGADDGATPEAATFHPVHGHGQWELPGSAVGSLELHRAPPLWVGLELHGVPLGWELLAPGDREVAFELDEADLASVFASVTLRPVDAHGGASLLGAKGTLKADVSSHRRDEHFDVAPRSNGTLRFERVVPGPYELVVAWREAEHQQRFDLAPGERLDLGDVALADRPGVLVRAVDERGEPLPAWIELAAYVPGHRPEDLFSPNLHRFAGDGEHALPAPTAPSIVRALGVARLPGPGGMRHAPSGERSAIVRLDPDAPPAGPLVLVVHRAVDVDFDAPPGTLEVLDELDLIVARPEPEDGAPRAELVPARYRVRRLGAEGRVLGEVAFDVRGPGLRVTVP